MRSSAKAKAGVGSRIQGLRLRLQRSEHGFASLLGVTQETIVEWECGRKVDRAVLVRIADTTDTAMEWLIAGLGPEKVDAIHGAALGRHPRGDGLDGGADIRWMASGAYAAAAQG